MRIFFITFVSIIFFLVEANSHMAHYKNFKNIKMEIFRNDKLIGNNDYYFNQKNKLLTVKNIINFKLDFMGATVFSLSGEGEETYLNGKLISYVSKTKQNNKQKFVNLKFNKETKKFDIKGSSYNGEASSEYIVGNWWNHNILKASAQISPISGSIKEQIIQLVEKEEIELYGEKISTLHLKLRSKDQNLPEDKKLNFDIWYNEKNGMILKVSYSKMGNWEYRLKSYELN
jgi:hypothetical protein|tara:strand:- start:42 stop:731 length:690 start_codon:yes stop_codon:yes gene_type:complete